MCKYNQILLKRKKKYDNFCAFCRKRERFKHENLQIHTPLQTFFNDMKCQNPNAKSANSAVL